MRVPLLRFHGWLDFRELFLRADIQNGQQHRRDYSIISKRLEKDSEKERKKETLALFAYKRQAPIKHIHKVRKPVRMRRRIELPDIQHILIVPQHRSLVIVHVDVVGRRENGHQRREPGRLALAVHAVPVRLRLVRPDDRQQPVLVQKVAYRPMAKEVRAPPHVVVVEFGVVVRVKVFERIRPQQVAHEPACRRLPEPVNLIDPFFLSRASLYLSCC